MQFIGFFIGILAAPINMTLLLRHKYGAGSGRVYLQVFRENPFLTLFNTAFFSGLLIIAAVIMALALSNVLGYQSREVYSVFFSIFSLVLYPAHYFLMKKLME